VTFPVTHNGQIILLRAGGEKEKKKKELGKLIVPHEIIAIISTKQIFSNCI
jgi:hypothetical protein